MGSEDMGIEWVENRDFIKRTIDKLEPNELVLKDRYFKGKTQAQIARTSRYPE